MSADFAVLHVAGTTLLPILAKIMKEAEKIRASLRISSIF